MNEIKVIRRKEAQRYALIDLPRTIRVKAPIYLRVEGGCTPTITQAGIFRLAEARKISLTNSNGLVVMLPIDQELMKHIEATRNGIRLYED